MSIPLDRFINVISNLYTMPEVETTESRTPVKKEVKEEMKKEVSEDETDSDEENVCGRCGSKDIRLNSKEAESYCRNCGIVLEEDKVDNSKEWRAFDSDEKSKKARAGGSITFTKADKGIGTEMGGSYEMGNASGKKRQKYYRIKKWSKRASNSKERGLQQALNPIKELRSEMNLPNSVYEESSRLVEKARKKDIIKGQGIRPTAAALIYIVSRRQNVPRTLEEVSEISGVKERKLGKTYRKIVREMELDLDPVQPEEFLPRYAGEIGIEGEIQAKARELLEETREEGVHAGRSPKTMVAGTIYLASKLHDRDITQKEIADEVNVTPVTIRKVYQEMVETLEIDEDEL